MAGRIQMSQTTARLPDDLVASLDTATAKMRRTRADVVRQTIEYYMDDPDDLTAAVYVLQDPTNATLDWEAVKKSYSIKIKQSAVKAMQKLTQGGAFKGN
jgi:predicted DNA-binding protein